MAFKASGDNETGFRQLLAKIGRRIDPDTLEEMKYQCADLAGSGKREKITTAQELFTMLEELDELDKDNVEFLMKILHIVDRVDLHKIVQEYSMSVANSSLSKMESGSSTNRVEQDSSKMHAKDLTQQQNEDTYAKKTTGAIKTDTHGENYTNPFDTSTDGDGYCVHPPQQYVGNAISPELQSGLDFVIRQISRGWQIAARHLGVPDTVIDDAEHHWPRSIRAQIEETFRYWARTDRGATLQKLIDALRLVRRNDLADRLQSNRY